jgi:NAD(P)H-dependent FMN reductase
MPNVDPIRLSIIVGSVRAGRFAPVVAGWFVGRPKQRDELIVDVVDLAEVAVPSQSFVESIDRADAVVVITPEYNHSFPGPLKTAIDSLGRPWAAQPVGLVSYGGISGGLRAVEALRLVFAELRALTIRETVSFAFAREQFDAHGEPRDPDAVNTAAGVLLDQLGWWARTLREGRAAHSYPR